jgi:peptide chain release factor 2
MDAQELKATLLDLKSRLEDIKVNVFQIEDKKKRLEEIENELSQEKVWSDLELSQKLSKEKTNLQKIISKYQTVDQKVSDSEVLIDISIEEKDDSAIKEVNQEVLEIY